MHDFNQYVTIRYVRKPGLKAFLLIARSSLIFLGLKADNQSFNILVLLLLQLTEAEKTQVDLVGIDELDY